MICPGCAGRLKIEQSITNEHGQARRAECKPCDRQFTLVTLVVAEARGGMERGQGAQAVARRLEGARVVFAEGA